MCDFTIREAMPQDTALILSFIHKLAEYENMEHEVIAGGIRRAGHIMRS